ncbi:MAG: hypothetical protein Q8L85_09515 [Alphaproteobacteria bacterium]|nr:hypothetical protein [Alphaproteobacteria bacterium]
MIQKKITIPAILVLFVFLLSRYINRIAENNTTIIILSYVFLACSFFAFFAYLWKLEKMESTKEERKKYLEQTIEKGSGYFVLKAGTSFSVLYILFIIALKYIENPNISFPYNNLWDIWIGYVWAILMWITVKRSYEKMK